MGTLLPVGEYRYEISRHGAVLGVEEAEFAGTAIRGVRQSPDGANALEVAAIVDIEGTVQQVKISYNRGFFKRNATYEASDETLRGSISALAGRNEILVKLGRFREISAELSLFRALLIARVRARGTTRWTGRVAVIDPATLVAASLKQSCRATDETGLRWSYEARMGDTELIELDGKGRLIERRSSDGTITRLNGFVPASKE
ncbi:MAG TPA: hypothetical protein VMU41_15295 [Candidatus Binataceae bacterium]|nr:hypothetical protein [Candidatus Binataceae bacterium]